MYKLIFERSASNRAGCRAHRCIVEEHPRGDKKIRSPYSFNLQAGVFDYSEIMFEKPPNRFYHVSCLEGIGVDLLKYMTRKTRLHPAIPDWLWHGGKAFDAAMYGAFGRALDRDIIKRNDHYLECGTGRRVCNHSLPFELPKSSDMVVGEMTGRTLIEVLLDTMDAGHLLPHISEMEKILLFEILGHVASSMTKAGLAEVLTTTLGRDARKAGFYSAEDIGNIRAACHSAGGAEEVRLFEYPDGGDQANSDQADVLEEGGEAPKDRVNETL